MITNNFEIKQHYQELQQALDEMTAYFIQDTGKFPSKTTIIELMEWLKHEIHKREKHNE